MAYIYKITNIIKGYIYIGQTKNIVNRERAYSRLYKSIQGQKKIYYSIRKYGWENHTFEIIEECDKSLLNEREVYWITYYNSFSINNKKGLNLTAGGSAICLHKKGELHPRYGSTMPEELKFKLSNLAKDRVGENNPLSKKVYQYDLDGNFIKEWISASIIQKELGWLQSNISECCNNKKGSCYKSLWFYEYKGEKIDKYIPNLTGGVRSIVQLDKEDNIINTFNSIIEASKKTGMIHTQILRHLQNKIKNIRKYTFKYND